MNDDPVNFSQFYQCISMAGDGYTVDNVAGNVRYARVKIHSIHTICPVKATKKSNTPSPVPNDPAREQTRLAFASGGVSVIDGIVLYPALAPVTPFGQSPVLDVSFQDPSCDQWFSQYVPPSMPDPFGNTRSTGGYYFTTAGTLAPGERAFADVYTDGVFNRFDVLMHIAGTGVWQLGTWLVQAIGSPDVPPLGPQIPCPGDFNGSGSVTVQDIFDFLAAYFTNDPRADINHSGSVTVQDIFDFLAAYFAGC
jgi:hypothetical protein